MQERALAAQRGWLLDNAARLLDSYNDDYTAGLLPLVWDLYDCPDEALTRDPLIHPEATVKHPYLNIFGVTTDSLMAMHLKQHHWIKGFLKCFVLVGSANVDTWRFWPGPQAYPADLVQGLRRVATQLLPLPEASLRANAAQLSAPLLASPVQLTRGEAAWAAWERYARATSFDLLRRDKIDDIYAVAVLLAQTLTLIPSAVQRVTAPATATLYGKGDIEGVRRLFYSTLAKSLLISVGSAIFIAVFGPYMILRLFTEGYLVSYVPLLILLLGYAIGASFGAVGATLASIGKVHIPFRISAACGMLNVILNILFIPILGINGAALATAVTMVINFGITVIVIHRYLGGYANNFHPKPFYD